MATPVQICNFALASLGEAPIASIENPKTDVEQLITGVSRMLSEQSDSTFWQLPMGAWYGSGKKPGKLGMLFPGQGAQYVGMLRDLACQFPQVLNSLTQANAEINHEILLRALTDTITQQETLMSMEELQAFLQAEQQKQLPI